MRYNRQGFDNGPGSGTFLAMGLLALLINLAWIAALIGVVVIVVRAVT